MPPALLMHAGGVIKNTFVTMGYIMTKPCVI